MLRPFLSVALVLVSIQSHAAARVRLKTLVEEKVDDASPDENPCAELVGPSATTVLKESGLIKKWIRHFSDESHYMCRCAEGETLATSTGSQCTLDHGLSTDFCKDVVASRPFSPEILINLKKSGVPTGFRCMSEAEMQAFRALYVVEEARPGPHYTDNAHFNFLGLKLEANALEAVTKAISAVSGSQLESASSHAQLDQAISHAAAGDSKFYQSEARSAGKAAAALKFAMTLASSLPQYEQAVGLVLKAANVLDTQGEVHDSRETVSLEAKEAANLLHSMIESLLKDKRFQAVSQAALARFN